MACIFVAINYHNAPYSSHSLKDGSSARSHLLDACNTLDLTIEKKILLNVKDSIDNISPTLANGQDFFDIEISDTIESLISALETIKNNSKSSSKNHFIIAWMDSMFHFVPLYKKIWDMHTQYHAHYSFAEGYPQGITPEILSFEAIEMMVSLLKNNSHIQNIGHKSLSRNSIFSVIEQQINDFDIEVVLASQDMREYRLSLTGDTRRNYVISKNLWEKGLRDPDEIPRYYQQHPQLFRGVPNYVYCQVSDIVFPCLYKHQDINKALKDGNSDSHYIDLQLWETMLSKLQAFTPEAVLSIGYNGEIATHPQVEDVLRIATQYFKLVYVETTGREWDNQYSLVWWNEPWVQNLIWIVSVDAYKEDTYKLIHGIEINPVLDFLFFLKDTVPVANIYPQAVRMPENEDELKHFLNHWESLKTNPIIQKYNDYCKTLPDKKIVNVAPIVRFACHHLSRDLVVLKSGKVVMCTQSMNTEHIIADLSKQSMEQVWNANEKRFVEQVQNKYNDICTNCDEYYIVNI